MKSKKKSTRYQNGGNSTNLTPQQINSLTSGNNSTNLQFTDNFANSGYFYGNAAPTQTSQQNTYSTQPIVDITSDGKFTPRKVWRTQHPEWFVGKQTPVDGKDYTTVSYNDWKNGYQNSPEYIKYSGQIPTTNSVAEFQFGGYNITGFNAPQQPLPASPSLQPNPYPLGNTPYQPVDYAQQAMQNMPLPNTIAPPMPTGIQAPNAVDYATKNITGVEPAAQPTTENTYDKTRFANIYGGFDIPSAAYTLGQGIESGNAFDITTGGLKLATGLGRNIAAGMGYQNRRENVLQNYQEKARNALRPADQSFQDGGMQMGQEAPPQEQAPQDQGQDIMQQIAQALQQGADPQQILQSLIQNGIPQDQAQQLVGQVMQQLQGAQQEQAPQEQQAMQMGGTSKKKVEIDNPNYLQEGGVNGEIVAELEKDEFVKTPNGEIKQVVGETHQNGGVKVTEEQLPNGSQIISDHLKVGKEGAKKFNDDYDLGIKSTDTYATVIDKFNRKSGIKKINDEQEIVLKNIEKQSKKLEDNPASSGTIKLNLQLYTDQLKELDEQKEPLVEARKALFDQVFKPQEESKQTGHNVEEAQKPIPSEAQPMQNGGIFNGDMILGYAQKHNLHPDRVLEIMQQHANGGIQQYQKGTTKNPIIQNSTLITDFPNQPTVIGGLPYTPRETNPNELWQGANYENVWTPLVEESLANPEQAKKIDDWLTANKGTFSPNVQKQLEGLTGDARIQKIKTLATDKFPGLFHNAVLSAIEATTPVTPTEATVTPTSEGYVASAGAGKTKYVLPNLPDQTPLMPDSLQGALKLTHRYDRIEAPLASSDAAIAEIRRQEQTAMQGIQNLPDAQKASAIAQIQANTQNAINQTTAQTAGTNQQSKFNADVANAQVQAREEDMRGKDLTDYEAKILKADAITQANLRNYYNAAQKVNLGNYNYVQGLNLINDRYDNAQFTGQGVDMVNLQKAQAYDNLISKTVEQRAADLKAEIAAKNKADRAKAKAKRFGGIQGTSATK